MSKVTNPHRAITICLPDEAGEVSRAAGIKVRFSSLHHLGCYLATVGCRYPGVTPATDNLFHRPCFMAGYGDGLVAGAEARGLVLSVAVFDVDVDLSLDAATKLCHLPYERLIWTTRSCTAADLHLRLVVALNRPIRCRAELAAMATTINAMIGGGIDVDNLKNLNHLHDVPLAAADMRHLEGSLFDIEGLMTAESFAAAGVPAAEEPEAPVVSTTAKVPGGVGDVARHFENIVVRQIARLAAMANGQRSDTCASVAAIIGSAYQGAVDLNVTLDEAATLDVLGEAIEQRAAAEHWEVRDTRQFLTTAVKQFAWGRAHPIEKMGEVETPLQRYRNKQLWQLQQYKAGRFE